MFPELITSHRIVERIADLLDNDTDLTQDLYALGLRTPTKREYQLAGQAALVVFQTCQPPLDDVPAAPGRRASRNGKADVPAPSKRRKLGRPRKHFIEPEAEDNEG